MNVIFMLIKVSNGANIAFVCLNEKSGRNTMCNINFYVN